MESRFRNPSRKELPRKAGVRRPAERVLIVCEGEKSELKYFNDVAVTYRINLTITTAQKRTEPIQIIQTAKDKLKVDKDFEWVYVVFDRDNHQTYLAALAKARELDEEYSRKKKPLRFIAIPSVPCFEFWLLLHYHYRDTRLTSAEALALLSTPTRLPSYSKGMTGLFRSTQDKLSQAKANAAKLRTLFTPDSGKDPYTAVDELIEGLERIKNHSR
jgi:hypothetical protein